MYFSTKNYLKSTGNHTASQEKVWWKQPLFCLPINFDWDLLADHAESLILDSGATILAMVSPWAICNADLCLWAIFTELIEISYLGKWQPRYSCFIGCACV
jgi:hypothetical protein